MPADIAKASKKTLSCIPWFPGVYTERAGIANGFSTPHGQASAALAADSGPAKTWESPS
jgi:hypothetical protein